MAINELQFMSGIKDGEYIYASALYFNALFRININSGETNYLGKFGQGEIYESVNHTNAIRVEDSIYFFPEAASGIDVYNVKTKDFSRIDLPVNARNHGYKGVQVGNNIFMIPVMGGNDILKFNVETNEVKIALKFEEYMDLFNDDVKGKVTFMESAARDGMLYLCCYETARLITIDTTKDMKSKIIDLKCGRLYGCFCGKTGIWVLELDRPIIHLVDYATCKIISTIKIHEQGGRYAEFNTILELHDEVLLFPSMGDYIFSCKNGRVAELMDIRKVKTFRHVKYNKIRYCINENNEVWILPRGTKNMLHIEEGEITEFPLYITKDSVDIIDQSIKQGFDNKYKDELLQEDEKLSLEQLIRCI